MSYSERIIELFDEELKHRIDILMTQYADVISKKYAISLDLLLRDVPVLSTNMMCKGTKPDGSRCAFKGIHEGYCGKHIKAGSRIRQRIHESHNGHTHGPEVLFSPGCVECNKSKQLIDLSAIFNNE
jgi:hypothetical protein